MILFIHGISTIGRKKGICSRRGLAVAPAQRLVDFAEGRFSSNLPDHSYLPGLNSSDLRKSCRIRVQQAPGYRIPGIWKK